MREAAQRLKDDMHAVELARLSDNNCAQYDPQAGPKQKKPPEPWFSNGARRGCGVPNWIRICLRSPRASSTSCRLISPFDPKTVVAFRGTTGEAEDILTDQ